MPFLIVGVEKSHNVFAYTFGSVAHLCVVVHVSAHITLRKLLLVAVFIKAHNLCDVHILGSLEAKVREELNVLCKAREPFLATDNVSSAHKVVVYCVSEVICGDSVGLEEYEVLVVFGNFKVALYKVCKLELLFGVAVCKNTKHEGVTCLDVFFNLFDCELTATEHFSLLLCRLCLPVCVLDFFLLINCVKLVKLFFSCEAGVSLTFHYELLCVSLVNFASHALLVGTVCALVADVAVVTENCAFVEVDAVLCKGLDKTFSSTSNLSLCVGVFNS